MRRVWVCSYLVSTGILIKIMGYPIFCFSWAQKNPHKAGKEGCWKSVFAGLFPGHMDAAIILEYQANTIGFFHGIDQ